MYYELDIKNYVGNRVEVTDKKEPGQSKSILGWTLNSQV
jgi:hypothetical protein